MASPPTCCIRGKTFILEEPTELHHKTPCNQSAPLVSTRGDFQREILTPFPPSLLQERRRRPRADSGYSSMSDQEYQVQFETMDLDNKDQSTCEWCALATNANPNSASQYYHNSYNSIRYVNTDGLMEKLYPHLQSKAFIDWVLQTDASPMALLDYSTIPFSTQAPPLSELEMRAFLEDLPFWQRSFRECEKLWRFSGVAMW